MSHNLPGSQESVFQLLVRPFFHVYNYSAVWGGGEMVDAADLKSAGRQSVWVRVPPALLIFYGPSWAIFCLWRGLDERQSR
jgi:hypothetical protein